MSNPRPSTLSALLDRVRAEPDAAVVGALLIEPRRRGAGTMVSNWAQTISGGGRLRPLTDPGELYQGQLESVRALGVPAAGMLVRGDAWRFLGGFNTELPRSHWGLDLGWRANLAGYKVVADPRAQLIDNSAEDDPVAVRAAGLALVAATPPRDGAGSPRCGWRSAACWQRSATCWARTRPGRRTSCAASPPGCRDASCAIRWPNASTRCPSPTPPGTRRRPCTRPGGRGCAGPPSWSPPGCRNGP